MIFMNKVVEYSKRFWAFLQDDSWASFAVTLLLAFVIIKFVFFPGLSFVTGTELPLVIVESCSMYHSDGLEDVLDNGLYDYWEIDLASAAGWSFKNGMSKGDVIFVVGVDEAEVGDVIIFNGGEQYPIIHRVVGSDEDGIVTKGDHNPEIYPFDKDIKNDQLIGKALFKVPFVGWAKLIFFESGRRPDAKGFCS
jgi:hypothetical protein